jgi:hypothetical protein
MKRLVNVAKYFVFMVVKLKEEEISDALSGCDPDHKHKLVKIISNYDDLFQEPTGFPPKREVEHESICNKMLLFLTLVCIDHKY